MFQEFVNLLFPNVCSACDNVLLKNETIICTTCIIELPKAELDEFAVQTLKNRFAGKVEIKAVLSCFKYFKGSKVQNLLHNLKYKNNQEVGLFVGRFFGNHLKSQKVMLELDYLIAVPLHQNKRVLRGFNQSELIADGLAEILNVPHETSVIFRNTATETQTRKTRIERFYNVNDVFVVNDKLKIEGKSIGLVDDVLTTGATLESCAIALLNAGAKEVTILAVAAA